MRASDIALGNECDRPSIIIDDLYYGSAEHTVLAHCKLRRFIFMFKRFVIWLKPSLISHRLGLSAYLDDATVCTGTVCMEGHRLRIP